MRLAKWQLGLGCSRYFLASLRSLVAPGDPCPHRGHATQRALWLGFLRRGANMSFRIYTFCIHPSERILALGDMKTFCVWGMSRKFAAPADWQFCLLLGNYERIITAKLASHLFWVETWGRRGYSASVIFRIFMGFTLSPTIWYF